MSVPPGHLARRHPGGMAFSFPFRVNPQGGVATVEPGSDQEVDELLAVLCLTSAGERVMEPDYGIPDPDWRGISESDVISGVEEYGPEGIEIVAVTEEQVSASQSAYDVAWTREPVEVENV